MADHAYFTSSKAHKDTSSHENPLKRKRIDHDDNSSLTNDTVTDPVITQQNEVIAELMQQINNMKIEIKKIQELTSLSNATSVPVSNDGKPSLQSPCPHQPIPIHPQPTPNTSPTVNTPPRYRPSPTNYQTHPSHYQCPQRPNIIPNRQPPPSNYQTPLCPKIQILVYPHQNHPNHHQVPPPPQNNYNSPHPNAKRKIRRMFTPLVESRTELFERLSAAGLIQSIPPKAMGANSCFLRVNRICAYHSNGIGHNTEDCINLKHRIQDLIDNGTVVLVKKNPSFGQEKNVY